MVKPCHQQKNMEPEEVDFGLWDRWIDGVL